MQLVGLEWRIDTLLYLSRQTQEDRHVPLITNYDLQHPCGFQNLVGDKMRFQPQVSANYLTIMVGSSCYHPHGTPNKYSFQKTPGIHTGPVIKVNLHINNNYRVLPINCTDRYMHGLTYKYDQFSLFEIIDIWWLLKFIVDILAHVTFPSTCKFQQI